MYDRPVQHAPFTFKFTGKERDSESGLDNFGARYDSSSLGRFMSPDWSAAPMGVPYANFGNPQSLNLYSYVKNNPLNFTDPDGHCCDLDDAVNFVVGLANAYGSDNLAGAGRQPQATFEGKVGAAVGDTIATVQGGLEVLGGGAGEVGGTGLILTGAGAPVGVLVDVGSAGLIVHGAATATAGAANLGAAAGDAINGAMQSSATGPYQRPNNAITQEQRDSVQGKPCATCGATGQKNNADHIDPLVEQHYRGGIDKDKMRSPDAVQPQCQNCSNQQGGYLSGFSKALKKLFGF